MIDIDKINEKDTVKEQITEWWRQVMRRKRIRHNTGLGNAQEEGSLQDCLTEEQKHKLDDIKKIIVESCLSEPYKTRIGDSYYREDQDVFKRFDGNEWVIYRREGMESDHYIKKCKICENVIDQCRCIDPNKRVIWSVCCRCKEIHDG